MKNKTKGLALLPLVAAVGGLCIVGAIGAGVFYGYSSLKAAENSVLSGIDAINSVLPDYIRVQAGSFGLPLHQSTASLEVVAETHCEPGTIVLGIGSVTVGLTPWNSHVAFTMDSEPMTKLLTGGKQVKFEGTIEPMEKEGSWKAIGTAKAFHTKDVSKTKDLDKSAENAEEEKVKVMNETDLGHFELISANDKQLTYSQWAEDFPVDTTTISDKPFLGLFEAPRLDVIIGYHDSSWNEMEVTFQAKKFTNDKSYINSPSLKVKAVRDGSIMESNLFVTSKQANWKKKVSIESSASGVFKTDNVNAFLKTVESVIQSCGAEKPGRESTTDMEAAMLQLRFSESSLSVDGYTRYGSVQDEVFKIGFDSKNWGDKPLNVESVLTGEEPPLFKSLHLSEVALTPWLKSNSIAVSKSAVESVKPDVAGTKQSEETPKGRMAFAIVKNPAFVESYKVEAKEVTK